MTPWCLTDGKCGMVALNRLVQTDFPCAVANPASVAAAAAAKTRQAPNVDKIAGT
jgi:hypothetical protein